MPFNASKEDWESAERFLAGKPDGTKLWRESHSTPSGKLCDNSFIIINNVIYTMDRKYIHNPHYANFKVKLCQDKNKKNYVMKLQKSAGSQESEYEKNEFSVENDLQLFIASGIRADNDKKIRIVTYSGVSLADYFENNKQKLLPSEVIDLFIHCALNVALLHDGQLSRSGKKYTYGDLKLDSFTIDERSRISLTNLGFCRFLPDTGMAALKGFKELYLERDIYSLGLLLTEMIQSFPDLKDDKYILCIINSMTKSKPDNISSIKLICAQLGIWRDSYNLWQLKEMIRRGSIAHANELISDLRIDFFKPDIKGKTVEDYAQQVGVVAELRAAHKQAIIRSVARALKSPNPATQIFEMNLLALTAYYQCINELVDCLKATGEIKCTKPILGRYDEVDSLLLWAMKHSHYQVIKLLVSKGAELNERGPQKKLLLDCFIGKQDIKMALTVLYLGAELTAAAKGYFLAKQSQVLTELEVLQRDISISDRTTGRKILDVIDLFVTLYSCHSGSGVTRAMCFFSSALSVSLLAEKNEQIRREFWLTSSSMDPVLDAKVL